MKRFKDLKDHWKLFDELYAWHGCKPLPQQGYPWPRQGRSPQNFCQPLSSQLHHSEAFIQNQNYWKQTLGTVNCWLWKVGVHEDLRLAPEDLNLPLWNFTAGEQTSKRFSPLRTFLTQNLNFKKEILRRMAYLSRNPLRLIIRSQLILCKTLHEFLPKQTAERWLFSRNDKVEGCQKSHHVEHSLPRNFQ